MTNKDEKVENLKKGVERKLAWHSSELWVNVDFQRLLENIFKSTGVSLHPITLKRLWGKMRYKGNPSPTTLDTLSQYLGYTNYGDYISKFEEEAVAVPNSHKEGVLIPEENSNKEVKRFKYKRVLLYLAPILY